MNDQFKAIRTVRRASGEELLMMAIVADRQTKQTIDAELERRSKPHLEGRLARRGSGKSASIATPAA